MPEKPLMERMSELLRLFEIEMLQTGKERKYV